MAGRQWGFWTRGKLDILRRYFDAFTTASKNQSEIVYLDLFAGEPQNSDRLTGAEIAGSALIALETDDPPFTRLRFFELEANAAALRDALKQAYPSRDFEVIAGDCNETLPHALERLASVAWAPTFGFIDPNGPDIQWRTLERLAQHKVRSRYKVELWILWPVGLFMRNLPRNKEPRPTDVAKLNRAFGTDAWQLTYRAYRRREIDGAQAREEYVNLMRWRLERELGYRWTHAFDVKNQQGASIYHLIFATDNDAGRRIMGHIYGQAAREFPKMAEEARSIRAQLQREQQGQESLFDLSDFDEPLSTADEYAALYEHRPPTPPRGIEVDP